MPKENVHPTSGRRLAKIDLIDSTAMHPAAGLVPSVDIYVNDVRVGIFLKVQGRFMPAHVSGQPLMMTVVQMDRVNQALGMQPETNRKPRRIFMAVPEHEILDLAVALVTAGVLP